MPTELPNKITSATPCEVFSALGRAWPDAAPAQLCVLLAQWALETARGAAMHCWNVGNIKCPAGDASHDYTYFACTEVVNGKTVAIEPPAIGCRFRAFLSLDAGVSDYLATVRARFGSAWPAVLAGDPESFAALLKAAGYYTAPEPSYAAGLRARYDEFSATTALLPGVDLYSVVGAQKALQALHYYAGRIDGDWGPLSKGAMVAFQRVAHLPTSGSATDIPTLVALAKAVTARPAA